MAVTTAAFRLLIIRYDVRGDNGNNDGSATVATPREITNQHTSCGRPVRFGKGGRPQVEYVTRGKGRIISSADKRAHASWIGPALLLYKDVRLRDGVDGRIYTLRQWYIRPKVHAKCRQRRDATRGYTAVKGSGRQYGRVCIA